jgi:hypothetical protein
MEAKEKAKELVEKYKFYVYCYIGNGMLTNDVDENIMLSNAKKCAIIAVNEMIVQNGELYLLGLANDYYAKKNAFLFELKNEIEKL